MLVKASATSVTTYFVLRDSTNHLPHTTLDPLDIDLYYTEFRLAESAKIDCTSIAVDAAYTSGGAAHCGHGVYRIDWPNEAFNGAIGTVVQLIVVCSGADTTFLEVELSAAVDAAAISGNATAADNLELGCGAGTYNLGGGAVVAASVTAGVTVATNSDKTGYALADTSSDAVIADAVWNAATATYGSAGSYGLLVESGNVGGGAIVAASVAGNVGGSVASVTGSVASVTGSVGSVAGTIGGLSTQAKADVNAEVDTALTDIDLDHLSKTGTAPTPTDGSFMHKLMSKTVSGYTYDQTSDSLEAMKDGSVTVSDLEDAFYGAARTKGSVVSDPSNSATTFETSLGESQNDHWNGAYLLFTYSSTGHLEGQVRKITDYNGSTKFVTVEAFTETPADGDDFIIINA